MSEALTMIAETFIKVAIPVLVILAFMIIGIALAAIAGGAL